MNTLINISLTKEEVQVLAQLLDMTVKAGGMQVAEACLFFTKKLAEASAPKQEALQEAVPTKKKA